MNVDDPATGDRSTSLIYSSKTCGFLGVTEKSIVDVSTSMTTSSSSGEDGGACEGEPPSTTSWNRRSVGTSFLRTHDGDITLDVQSHFIQEFLDCLV